MRVRPIVCALLLAGSAPCLDQPAMGRDRPIAEKLTDSNSLARAYREESVSAFSRAARAEAPLPPPRPAELSPHEAPLPPPRPNDLLSYAPEPQERAAPLPAPTTPADDPACLSLLSHGDVVADRVAPIVGDGGCGIATPVSLEAVILPERRRVDLVPHPTMRCALAAQVARWILEDLAPLLERDGRKIERIANADSYDCRGRNRQAGARLSEHASGDAIDVVAVQFADGRAIRFADKQNDPDVATALRDSACARFTTVLGPGSDGYHENHVHLDLAARRNGGRLCEWNVR